MTILIELSVLVAGLETPSPGRILGQSTDAAPGVLDDIESVLDSLEALELVDVHAWARTNIAPFQERFSRMLEMEPGACLRDEDAKELCGTARELSKRVREESRLRTVFLLPYDKENYGEELHREPRSAFAQPSA